MRHFIISLLTALIFSSCIELPGEITACPDLAAVGVDVTVRDAKTGARICDATVKISDGSHQETLHLWGVPGPECSYAGAYNRPGSYLVEVSHPTFVTATTTATVTSSGECPSEITPAKVTVDLVGKLQQALKGGVLATFDVTGQKFKAWFTSSETIQQLLDLQSGKSTASIPNGRIHRGPGQGDHNLPYGWHLDPTDTTMAEMTMELCDAAPSYVQENIAEFVDNVQRYCPWSAKLVSLEDFR